MPLEAGIAQAVELALALKHARALLQVQDLVSQAIALPGHPSACARADASGQLQELPFCPFQAESQCAEHFSAHRTHSAKLALAVRLSLGKSQCKCRHSPYTFSAKHLKCFAGWALSV